jgi:hypothetical protein
VQDLDDDEKRVLIAEALIETMDMEGLTRVRAAASRRLAELTGAAPPGQFTPPRSPFPRPAAGHRTSDERPPASGYNPDRDAFLRRTRLETFQEQCIANRWTRDNPAALARAAELGGPEFVELIPATLEEMDLPTRVGQVRYVDNGTIWHVVRWVGRDHDRSALCAFKTRSYGNLPLGQSRPPTPEQGHVCRLCELRLKK